MVARDGDGACSENSVADSRSRLTRVFIAMMRQPRGLRGEWSPQSVSAKDGSTEARQFMNGMNKTIGAILMAAVVAAGTSCTATTYRDDGYASRRYDAPVYRPVPVYSAAPQYTPAPQAYPPQGYGSPQVYTPAQSPPPTPQYAPAQGYTPSGYAAAPQGYAPGAAPVYQAAQPALLNNQQLDQVLGPIALYPDPLLSQVLAAATYPQDIGSAAQWLQYSTARSEYDINGEARDPSVKALVHYPSVVNMLASQPGWTATLGAAFATQPQDVMNSIQRLRVEAQECRHW